MKGNKQLAYFLFLGIACIIIGIFWQQLSPQQAQQLSEVVVSPTPIQTQPPPTPTETAILGETSEVYPVTRVIDGDTIEVQIDGKKETVRLIGIDTPEVVDPRSPIECFGKQASEKAKSLLVGQGVILKADPTQSDKDRYARLLRYVYHVDGAFINDLLVREGYAHEYTYQNDPYIFQQQFKDAEKEAQENKRGLWAENACAE